MAKQRKQKIEEPKPENSGAVVVHHQKLCLSVDITNRQIRGYTDLEIAVPDIGIVGLHAENLGIGSVFVDGEPAEFEYYPRPAAGDRWRTAGPNDADGVADAAGAAYVSALERELVPNLLINCCKAFRVSADAAQVDVDNGAQSSGEAKQNVKLVRINYWVEKAESGIHFDGNVMHTDNQLRRSRCWFPCIDGDSQRWCYDLEFTVAHDLVAVSSGTLLYQVLSKDDPPHKTFVYRLDVPAIPRWISLVVAPFEILPDPHVGLVSHMCLSANLTKLKNTMEFFHNAFNHYEEYLGSKFPFGSYTQVFIAPEMAVSSVSCGAAITVFSSQVLYDDKVIDMAMDTSIKLAFALAKQWFGVYIAPEDPNDEWLLDGLAVFLTDLFIKKFLGNNEARYRRYKANSAVCKADDTGATMLSSSSSCKDLYGTHCMGVYGKIRAWKSVAVLQMMEKQMGPEPFRKILQKVVFRAREAVPLRSLSTKEFRHFATKVGNLERPFVKEFFPRWVYSSGCPVLRMGFSYNKRKNMVELAVLRESTAPPDSATSVVNPDSDNREGDMGWPGMMSIRVHELDGMYDHPVLPLTGEMWQLLEIPCHSKLAARRFMKPKKGSKPDGSEENDILASADARLNMESPLSWIRADPEMEYLADIQVIQPVQMWINQLEKDGDVVAQAQAISALENLPQLSFSVVNALSNILSDSKVFWRVRVKAAFALASRASEETDWAGLLNLVKFYKGRRFDATIGLPKPNDFRDFPEYFVLKAILHAVAMVRTADKKSPREAVEFILQLLKYNDNTGNPYSDVFWLAGLVQAAGEVEFGQQSILFLSALLKRIDRLLQFDRLMPSYNGILTSSCIRTLAQITLKFSESVQLDHVIQLIRPFREHNAIWHVRIEASRALLDLEFHFRGLNAALLLFVTYLKEESSLRGEVKLSIHTMRLCQIQNESDSGHAIQAETLVALLSLLEGSVAYNNILLRHYLFCIIQTLARREPTLYGVPRDKMFGLNNIEFCGEPKNIFAVPSSELVPLEPPIYIPEISHVNISSLADPNKLDMISVPEVSKEVNITSEQEAAKEVPPVPIPDVPRELDNFPIPDALHEDGRALESHEERNLLLLEDTKADTISAIDQSKVHLIIPEAGIAPGNDHTKIDLAIPEPVKEADTVSNSHERKVPVLKIRVKQSAASSRVETDNRTIERSHCGNHDTSRRASSSVSVDAPQRNSTDAVSVSNQHEEVNSCLDHGSRMTASIGSAKLASDEFGRDLQCTADSSKVFPPLPVDPPSPSALQDGNVDADAQKYASLQTLSGTRGALECGSSGVNVSPHAKKDKEKKRKRDHKSHRDDPAYLEKKRLKKEKKQKKKEMAKLLDDTAKAPPLELKDAKDEPATKPTNAATKLEDPSVAEPVPPAETKPPESAPPTRFRIKLKNKLTKP